jgi:hypothetical protein
MYTLYKEHIIEGNISDFLGKVGYAGCGNYLHAALSFTRRLM